MTTQQPGQREECVVIILICILVDLGDGRGRYSNEDEDLKTRSINLQNPQASTLSHNLPFRSMDGDVMDRHGHI